MSSLAPTFAWFDPSLYVKAEGNTLVLTKPEISTS